MFTHFLVENFFKAFFFIKKFFLFIWAKAKYFWLHDHLKLEPSQNEYDCFGYTEDFFIKGFHKLQEYKLKYFYDCQSRLLEMSTQFFNTITIDQCTQLKPPCETTCDICRKEECESIIFKQDPIWLFIKEINRIRKWQQIFFSLCRI